MKALKGFAAPVFIFGGVIRDLMLKGPSISPRDVDLVVGGIGIQDMGGVFAEGLQRRNRFGGLHVAIHGWHFDVWPLGETWAFRQNFVAPATFETLPKTTFLNIEAVVVRLDTKSWRYREIHTHGFFEALLTRTLEINCEANPYPILCVVRSLLMAAKLQFAIGPRLASYICEHARTVDVDQVMDVQWQHYKRFVFDVDTFKLWLSAITSQRKLSKESVVRLPAASRQLSLPAIPKFDPSDRIEGLPRRRMAKLAWY
ncbi:MAG TPA: hypothetical protein VM940_12010 [Chthoniobacterales bacterium]|nr:hypothetical protein [Chthoniobacterales bacterium]